MADNKKGSLAEKINFGGKNKKGGFLGALSDKMKKMKIKKMAKKKIAKS